MAKGKGAGFACAVGGIIYALKTQLNMRIHVAVAIVTLLLARLLGTNQTETLWIILAVFLVLIAEMFNTAVEVLVDLVSPGYHPLARAAKDVAAGAVLLAVIHALTVAWVVFSGEIMKILHS